MSIEAAVHGEIERLASDYVEFLRSLIRVPSVTGSEGPCQTLVKRRMLDLGFFEAEVLPGNHPPFWPTQRAYEGRPCLVGRLGSGPGARFLLNAHIDTAPVEDAGSWTFPPFSADIQGDLVYGRGSVDDKAGVSILLMVAEALRRQNVKLPGTLFLESVVEDEDSGNGSLACHLAGYACDAAIVIDGTWPGRIIDGHLGQAWLEVWLGGTPTAASSRRRGSNPIEGSICAIEAMKTVLRQMCAEIPQWQDVDDPFFLNVGAIEGGKWPGAVPESCRLAIQVGFPPPYTPDDIAELLERAAAEALREMDGVTMTMRLGALATRAFSNRNNRMVALLTETIRRLGTDPGPVLNQTVRGHCDLRHLRKADGSPADAVLYGPGGGGNPHARDEYYRLDHFVPVARTIASTLLTWFGVR